MTSIVDCHAMPGCQRTTSKGNCHPQCHRDSSLLNSEGTGSCRTCRCLGTQQPQSFGTRSRANSKYPPTKLFGHTLDGAVGLDGDTAIATSTRAEIDLDLAKEIANHVFTQIILAVWTLAKGDAARRESLSQISTTEVTAYIMDCQPFANIAGYGKRVAMFDRFNMIIVGGGVKNVGHVQSKTIRVPCSAKPNPQKVTSFLLIVTRDQLW